MGYVSERGGVVRVHWRMGGRRCSMVVGGGVEVGREVLVRVERLVELVELGLELDGVTRVWLGGVGERMRGVLEGYGLVGGRRGGLLGSVLREVCEGLDVSEGTRRSYGAVARSLVGEFGEYREVETLCRAELERWLGKLEVCEGTRGRYATVAKVLFGRGERLGLCVNPAGGLIGGSSVNRERMRYVGVEEVERLLGVCDGTMRGLVSLARWCGLRSPSESRGLRWCDVHDGWLQVGGKTGSRMVPLGERVRAELGERGGGEEAVLKGLAEDSTLRMRLRALIEKAGMEPWPRVFHNLRASCAMDWVKRVPATSVAQWMGHGLGVSMDHYLQAQPEQMAAAREVVDGVRSITNAA